MRAARRPSKSAPVINRSGSTSLTAAAARDTGISRTRRSDGHCSQRQSGSLWSFGASRGMVAPRRVRERQSPSREGRFRGGTRWELTRSERPRTARLSVRVRYSRFAGPRHPDKQKPSLFFVFAGVVGPQGPFVRQQPLLDPDDINDGKLEPFCRVQRHQRDAVGRAVHAVDVGHEGRCLEKTFQTSGSPVCRRRIRPPR